MSNMSKDVKTVVELVLLDILWKVVDSEEDVVASEEVVVASEEVVVASDEVVVASEEVVGKLCCADVKDSDYSDWRDSDSDGSVDDEELEEDSDDEDDAVEKKETEQEKEKVVEEKVDEEKVDEEKVDEEKEKVNEEKEKVDEEKENENVVVSDEDDNTEEGVNSEDEDVVMVELREVKVEEEKIIGQEPGRLTLVDLYNMQKKGQLLRRLDYRKVQKAMAAPIFHKIFDAESNGSPVIIVSQENLLENGKPTKGIFIESNNRMCALSSRGITANDDVTFLIPVTYVIVNNKDFEATWANTKTLSFRDNFHHIIAQKTNRRSVPKHVVMAALSFLLKSCTREETLYTVNEQVAVILPLLESRFTPDEIQRMRKDAIFRNQKHQELVDEKLLPPCNFNQQQQHTSDVMMVFLTAPLTRSIFLQALSNGFQWPTNQNCSFIIFNASLASDMETSDVLLAYVKERNKEQGKAMEDAQQHKVKKTIAFFAKLTTITRLHNAAKTPKNEHRKRIREEEGRTDGSIKKVAKLEDCKSATTAFVLIRDEDKFSVQELQSLNYVIVEETAITLRKLASLDDNVHFQTSRFLDDGVQKKCLAIGKNVVKELEKPSASYSSLPNLVNALMGNSKFRKGCSAQLFELEQVKEER